MASIIKTLKTYLTNKTIYPRTVTQAVYDSEGKRLDNILGKADISAISDGTVTGAIAAVSNKADKNEESIITVEAIAKGRNQARVFSTTESMENWLSDSANKGVANVGDNLYIVAVDVPDWWISSVLEAPNESGMYYEIAQLETQKVDLTTIENAINSIDSKIGSTDISEIGDGTLTGGLNALNSKLGNTDISAIGDGTLTGGLDALNNNLIIESVEFIPSFPAYKVGHTIEIYKQLSNLEKVNYIELGITQYKSVNDYTILPLYSTSPPYLVVGSLWIYKVGNVALYKQSETTECYISGNYIFE